MLNLDLLRQMLIIAMALSTVTCAFIQKNKSKIQKKVRVYAFIV